jgi:hypothetical protein
VSIGETAVLSQVKEGRVLLEARNIESKGHKNWVWTHGVRLEAAVAGFLQDVPFFWSLA